MGITRYRVTGVALKVDKLFGIPHDSGDNYRGRLRANWPRMASDPRFKKCTMPVKQVVRNVHNAPGFGGKEERMY